MTETIATIAARCAASGTVTAEDVLALRRASYGDGAISRAEAEALIRLEASLKRRAPEWNAYLVEAVTDHAVHQMQPPGYVDAAGARWLMAEIGAQPTSGLVDVVATVVEKAREVPVELVTYALDTVRRAVVSGEGPTRDGSLEPGNITPAEIALIRRVIHAAGGEAGIAVSRAEAEMLFDIDDEIGKSAASPAWCDLFARAVGNHLTSTVLFSMPSREDVLRRQAWLDAPDPTLGLGGVFGFLARGLTGLGDAIESVGGNVREERAKELSERIDAAATITADEAAWVVDRLNRDGDVSPAEAHLLRFLSAEASRMPDDFARLVERLKHAA